MISTEMQVTKSDIDQLILGYVAEERYIGTRDRLFDESPNLPEKVHILPLFGDISSEYRLHTILQEYVHLKTKQLSFTCPLCNDCNSLSDLFRGLHQLADRIESFKRQEPVPSNPPTSAPTPEIQRLSPSFLSQDRRDKSNHASKMSVSGLDKDKFHRKQFNPVTQLFEPIPDQANLNLVNCGSGSSRRKKTTMPKRLNTAQQPSPLYQPTDLYAHNGDLSKLLHTTDTTDALALVGVKILSNIKKCAGKGTPTDGDVNRESSNIVASEPTQHCNISPIKHSSAPALDIDDLISDETRGGLVEMTIDSLLNPDPNANTEKETTLKNFDEDLIELRKLLQFDDSNMSSITLPDVIQNKQDERYLMDIIKDDDNDLPENPKTPTTELPSQAQLTIDGSSKASGQSPDEKQAVAGLLAIQCSRQRKDSDTEKNIVLDDGNLNHQNNADKFELPSVVEHEKEPQSPIMPTIINVESHTEKKIDEQANEEILNRTEIPVAVSNKQTFTASNVQPNSVIALIVQPDIVGANAISIINSVSGNINCGTISHEDNSNKSTMPPKKRFLAKETLTPEKSSTNSKTAMVNQLDAASKSKKLLNSSGDLTNFNQETHQNLCSPDLVSAAVVLSNLESTLPIISSSNKAVENTECVIASNYINSNTTTENDGDKNSLESGLSYHLRRSKRNKKTNFSLRDVVSKRRSNSRGRKSDESKQKEKENYEKKTPKKAVNKEHSTSLIVEERNSIASKQLHVVNPGKGSVTLKLKNAGRMPLLCKGILVRPNEGKLSQEDLLGRLVGQYQDKNSQKENSCSTSIMDKTSVRNVEKHQDETNGNQSVVEAPTVTNSMSPTTSSIPSLSTMSQMPNDQSYVTKSATTANASLVTQIQAPESNVSSPAPQTLPHMLQACDQTIPQNSSTVPQILPSKQSYNSSTNALMFTPEKLTSPSKFSTISPSSGVFSVISDQENTSDTHFENQLIAAKSNLTKLFASSEQIVRCVNTNAIDAEESFVAAENYASTPTSVTITNSSTAGVFVSVVPDNRLVTRMEPQIRVRKRAKAQVKETGTKLPGLKKPHSIYMCNNKKEMVRIEPKRSSKVRAVRRSLVPIGSNAAIENLNPSHPPKTTNESSRLQNLSAEDNTTVNNTTKKCESTKKHPGNDETREYELERLLANAGENANVLTSPSKTMLNLENVDPLEKLVQNVEFEESSKIPGNLIVDANALQPEVQLVNLDLPASGDLSTYSKKVSPISTTKRGTVDMSESISYTMSSPSQEERHKLKRKKKRSLSHERKKKQKTKGSPFMRLSYNEIQAKLDALHGKKDDKIIENNETTNLDNKNMRSPERIKRLSLSEIQAKLDSIHRKKKGKKKKSKKNSKSKTDTCKDHKKENLEIESSPRRSHRHESGGTRLDSSHNAQDTHRVDETRNLLFEMEPLDFSLSSWANSDTMQRMFNNSPFKIPENCNRNHVQVGHVNNMVSSMTVGNITNSGLTLHNMKNTNARSSHATSQNTMYSNQANHGTSGEILQNNEKSLDTQRSEELLQATSFLRMELSKSNKGHIQEPVPHNSLEQHISEVDNKVNGCDVAQPNVHERTLNHISCGEESTLEAHSRTENENSESEPPVLASGDSMQISKKNKKKRRSREKHKRYKTKNKLQKLSYEEIQAKLDSVHGKKTNQNDSSNLKSPEIIKFLTPDEIQAKLDKIHGKKKSKKRKSLDSELKFAAKMKSGEEKRINDTNYDVTSVSNVDVHHSDNASGKQGNTTNISEGELDNSALYIDENNRSVEIENCNVEEEYLQHNTLDLSSQNLSLAGNMSTVSTRVFQSPEKIEKSSTMDFEIEPLDLSLPSWSNAKSSSKSDLNTDRLISNDNSTSSQQSPTQVEQASLPIPHLVDKEHNKTRKSLNQAPDKSSRKVVEHKRRSKKVNLKDMNVSKFLDTLNYK